MPRVTTLDSSGAPPVQNTRPLPSASGYMGGNAVALAGASDAGSAANAVVDRVEAVAPAGATNQVLSTIGPASPIFNIRNTGAGSGLLTSTGGLNSIRSLTEGTNIGLTQLSDGSIEIKNTAPATVSVKTTSPYNVVLDDHHIFMDVDTHPAGLIHVIMPGLNTVGDTNRRFALHHVSSSGTVRVVGAISGVDQIVGATSYDMTPDEALYLVGLDSSSVSGWWAF